MYIDGDYKGGHVISMERTENGEFKLYDPQNGQKVELEDILPILDVWSTLKIVRVDNVLIKPELVNEYCTKL